MPPLFASDLRESPSGPEAGRLGEREPGGHGWVPGRRRLLWVDGLAGLTVGVATLLLMGWLVRWYQLPRDLLIVIGVANVVYGLYSLSLAARARRPKALLRLLVAANALWAVACLRWVVVYGHEASGLGVAHLSGEALFVGGLAALEWRWIDLLLESPRGGPES